MTTLQLAEANNSDILQIQRETRKIWSGGLSFDKCIQSIHNQTTHPWGRKHLRYLLLKSGSEIVASLKFYSICISSKNKTYNLAGLGAIYTMLQHRNQGVASKLVRSSIELAQKEGLDGLLLFSDIDPDFYEKLDFVDLGSYNFELRPEGGSNFYAHLNKLEKMHIPWLLLSYNRFLARRSYGCQRSELFWRYKIDRENFFHSFSGSEWPGIKLLTLADPESGFSSYALIENSSKAIRVLEVVGDETDIWGQILALAKKLEIPKICGFEGSAPLVKGARLVERTWANPMLLPLNPAVQNWLDAQPCPLLELDHF
jgi:predicted N-acetyltransferase YhbS